jgi:hypothetical protein
MRSEINRNDVRLLLAANLAGLLIFTEAGKEARHRRIGGVFFQSLQGRQPPGADAPCLHLVQALR